MNHQVLKRKLKYLSNVVAFIINYLTILSEMFLELIINNIRPLIGGTLTKLRNMKNHNGLLKNVQDINNLLMVITKITSSCLSSSKTIPIPVCIV